MGVEGTISYSRGGEGAELCHPETAPCLQSLLKKLGQGFRIQESSQRRASPCANVRAHRGARTHARRSAPTERDLISHALRKEQRHKLDAATVQFLLASKSHRRVTGIERCAHASVHSSGVR